MNAFEDARKGQVEFVVVLGLLVVAFIIIYYAVQYALLIPSSVPQSVREQQKMVEDSIVNIARWGADLTLRELMYQGGYLFYPDLNVEFGGIPVVYWQQCQNDFSPTEKDIKDRLEWGINYTLYESLNSTLVYGKNVSYNLSELSVTVNMLENKLDVNVYLPTSVQGYNIEQPYRFSVPTKLGRIYKFAKDFVKESASKRFFETFTIANLIHSKMLPTVGVLVGCGNNIELTKEQVEDALEDIVEYSVINTIFWEPMPNERVYSIESVNGKQYRDLNIELKLPDNFDIESGPVSIINERPFIKTAFVITTVTCIRTYHVGYQFIYPLIVRVMDPLTGYPFQFGVLVYVDTNADNVMVPGTCDFDRISETVGQEEFCNHSVIVRVVDERGTPVKDAKVIFGFDCMVGETNSSGYVEGYVSEDIQDLYIVKSGYTIYMKNMSYQDVNGTYTIRRIPELTVRFYEVNLDNCSKKPTGYSAFANFSSVHGNIIISNAEHPNSTACINQTAADCIGVNGTYNSTCILEKFDEIVDCMSVTNFVENVSVNYLPAGYYSIDADIIENASSQENTTFLGGFIYNYTLTGENGELGINIPLLEHPITQNVSLDTELKLGLTEEMLNKCNIEPVERVI